MTLLFRGTATCEVGGPPRRVFDVATSPALLNSWLPILQRVRLDEGGTGFRLGSTFLADEAFADAASDRDQRFRVTECVPGETFGFDRVDGGDLVALLQMHGERQATRVTWTLSTAPPPGVERVLAGLMRRSVQKQANRQADSQLHSLARLVEQSNAGGRK